MKRFGIYMFTLTVALSAASVAVAQDDMYFTKKTMEANADNPTAVRPRGYTYSDNQSAYVPTVNTEADSLTDDVIYLDNDTTMGLNMDVDAYNRRGRSYSDESYADSMAHDTVYVTRRIEFIDNGWYDPWCWRSWWYDPWYDPWYYDSWYYGPGWAWAGWHHHWYGPGWYDPWYGPGWYRPWYGPGHVVAYSRPNSRNHSNIGRVYADRGSRSNSFSREGSSRRGFSNSNTTFGRNNTNNNTFGNTRSSNSFGNTRSNSSFGNTRSNSSFGGSRGGSFGGGARGGGFGGGRRR